ncbi:MAG: glycosyltransferase family 39 protein [Rudaea sp.]|uniref:ArnT family glycosyltransferase n=1 Tax=Rudaea sp. TaxID=2136325 RepID=UPI0039E633B5
MDPRAHIDIAGNWRRWAIIVVAALVYACALQGVRPLYSPDEGRYPDVAIAMLDSGDWVHPMLHHEIEHWAKPPLTYWSLAASIGLFGRHEFAARLPCVLAFVATILLVLWLGKRLVLEQPWLPALIYASFAFPPLAANLSSPLTRCSRSGRRSALSRS